MHGVTPLTGVTDAESPYTIPKHTVRFRSVDDPWGHTTARRSGPLGTPESFTAVFGIGQGLGTLGSLTELSVQGVSR